MVRFATSRSTEPSVPIGGRSGGGSALSVIVRQPESPQPGTVDLLAGTLTGSAWGQAALARNGGAGGIRTLEGVAPLRHFQCRALGQLGDRSPGGF